MMLLLGLAACSSGGSGGSSSGGTSWTAVKSAGVLKTCALDGLLPYSSSDANKPGLEIELAQELAKRLGVKNQTVWVGTWDGLIPSLTSGQCDAVIDGLFITDERKKVVDFTDPTWGSGEVIIVQKSDDSIKTLQDLKGKCVGALQGSVTVDELAAAGIGSPRIYTSQDEVILDVTNGGCEAGYLESPSAGWALKQSPNSNLKIVDSYQSPELFYEGIAVKKNSPELLDKLNSAIKGVQSDGTLSDILKKYGVPVYLPKA
jgi:polar amino acid transport system substrate-binding protein